MVALVRVIHTLVCLALVVVVLLQQGKGADIGAVFGGSSQTVFGASGAGNFLTRLTAVFAAIFFATAIFLAYASGRRATGSLLEGAMPAIPHTQPAGSQSKNPVPVPVPAPNPVPVPMPAQH